SLLPRHANHSTSPQSHSRRVKYDTIGEIQYPELRHIYNIA
ncbi:14355_t:CDS:1, partial [Ambispora leptoticha]